MKGKPNGPKHCYMTPCIIAYVIMVKYMKQRIVRTIKADELADEGRVGDPLVAPDEDE